jgi:putative transposase
MPRRPRNTRPDGAYHVTIRAMFRLRLFVDDRDRQRFIWLLSDFAAQAGIKVYAYCLMDTHYHLLVEGSSTGLSRLMHRLDSRYAQRYNARHDHTGHVFAERYSAYLIRDDAHLERAIAYIQANPVSAGLCEQVEDWPWTWIDAAKPVGQTPSGSVPEG